MTPWRTPFAATLKDLDKLCRGCRPSRFKAFVDGWMYRGVCITSDPDELRRQISNHSEADAAWLYLTSRLEAVPISGGSLGGDEVGGDAAGSIASWESLISTNAMLLPDSNSTCQLIEREVEMRRKGSLALYIIDSHFWDGRNRVGRNELFRRLLKYGGIRRIEVVSEEPDQKKRKNREKQSISHTVKILSQANSQLILKCYVLTRSKPPALHDRFYALYESSASPDQLEAAVFCASIGPGVMSFNPRCQVVRAILQVRPPDLAAYWQECLSRERWYEVIEPTMPIGLPLIAPTASNTRTSPIQPH